MRKFFLFFCAVILICSLAATVFAASAPSMSSTATMASDGSCQVSIGLTLRLDDGPILAGAEITLPGWELPVDCDILSMLSVLWETGRVKIEEIVLKL